jgi:hypothetical protein
MDRTAKNDIRLSDRSSDVHVIEQMADKESSFGLFQLNTRGGLGVGHTENQLVDPPTNIELVIAKINTVSAFVNPLRSMTRWTLLSGSLSTNTEVAIRRRLEIATSLIA